MIRICAWCKENLGEKEPLENKSETHDICKPCADAMKAKYRMSAALDTGDIASIKHFLDGGKKLMYPD